MSNPMFSKNTFNQWEGRGVENSQAGKILKNHLQKIGITETAALTNFHILPFIWLEMIKYMLIWV